MVRAYRESDRQQMIQLIADMRVLLAGFRSIEAERNIESAREELDEYLKKGYPIYVHEKDERILGYLVCRVDDDVVWAESVYVLPDSRRLGVGSALYDEAERLAREKGSETVYNWVHPNNQISLEFLKSRGYTVLNLIEIRRPYDGESLTKRIPVGLNEFDY